MAFIRNGKTNCIGATSCGGFPMPTKERHALNAVINYRITAFSIG
jgi:hypothetical protein